MLSQGDIVLIPIPFSDLTSQKRRPVLVLSNSDYNQRYQDVIVAAITSNVADREYQVIITNEDMTEGELKVISAVRADKIYTLSQSIVIKKFGKLQPVVLLNVKKQIDSWSAEKAL
ncbi:type II toxin-antitoxin system PemK/MazF family toxin [Paenibacillus hexagrammi]|uniref:Type II toxin-antitoxin system PemK/MazF family toxin n=1 Tax=Paenibacillus hexagrammi TaxID=2908839 RepID=A0ABY3SJX2_9BACL|nr:type II toxin-antitoxin system PemK/MazF family toxin [Paenibacillus sp. YPD9-1]UJF33830.1 type II toxin-antitoxin system PemK/MazF family toxin [Paenibacillus sp. YPD9-1]